MKTLLTALALLAVASTCHAGLYKCVDANGTVTFSQTQCAVDATPVEVVANRPSA
jgi:hypothetical protein